MADKTTFKIPDPALFKRKALQWACQFNVCCLLDSNDYASDRYSSYEWLLAIDAPQYIDATENCFELLENFLEGRQEMTFGFLSYELKDEIESLSSSHSDNIGFPRLYFFQPRYLIEIRQGYAIINRNYPEAFDLFERILQMPDLEIASGQLRLKARTTKESYLDHVIKIKSQIIEGDFYELNYCCEFFNDSAVIHPLSVFDKLNRNARAPFSSFFKLQDKYLLCASPERFLKKTGAKLISQPIKGTHRKSTDPIENERLRTLLLNSVKDRAENVMITDLVRNDLAKNALPGSVKVEELFALYEFNTVHQLISTVTAECREGLSGVDAICGAFPMGSMTGAPKVEVMKNIEIYEDQRRGLYSGALGYFTPEGNFDLNVVIRSIFYQAGRKYLSVMAGGAITCDSVPLEEYDEILLKAGALFEALNATLA